VTRTAVFTVSADRQ